MAKRTITGLSALFLFLPICFLSNYVIFPIVIALLCLIAVFEMGKCLGFDKKLCVTIPMYIIALGLPILRYFEAKIPVPYFTITVLVFFAMLIYILAYVMFTKNTVKVSEILTFYSMFVYIVGGFTSIVLVRYASKGAFMFLLVFMGAWICDTSAYFVGKFLGKHKLIPEISPKKTIEGSIGGVVVTFICFIIFGLVVNNAFDADISYIHLCVLGLILPTVSQIGDLIASAVKRQYNLKDYGNLFPGHGGILDRFDGVLLTAPTMYAINLVISWF